MKKLITILHQVFAAAVVTLMILSLPGPSITAPSAAAESIIPLTGEGGLLSIIQDTIVKRVKAFVIRRMQQRLNDFLNQISVDCPDYLKISGTDICQRIVGDWKEFIENATKRAEKEVMGDIQAMNVPPNLKTALLQSISIAQGGVTDYTLPAVVDTQKYFSNPHKYGSWDAWQKSFEPQNTLLGQIIMADDQLIRTIAENQEAAERSTRGSFVDEFECTDPIPKAGKPGKFDCAPGGWQKKLPAETKKEITSEILLSDFREVINMESIGKFIGSAIALYIEDVLDKGIFNASPPQAPATVCGGLTDEAKAICECQVEGVASDQYEACIETKLGIIDSLTVSPPTLPTTGGSINLSWSTKTTAVSCETSGSWSGTKNLSGSETIALPPPLTDGQTFSYSLTCRGRTGGTETKSVTVTVQETKREEGARPEL